MVMLLIIKLFKNKIYTRDRGHVWSGGGAVSQWARLDPTVNKRQGSRMVRGRGCVPVGQA